MKNLLFIFGILLTLGVNAQVTITSLSASICDGYFTFLYVDVEGYDNDTLNYQWTKNGIYIPGANLDTIVQGPSPGTYNYQVTVTTPSNIYIGTAFYTVTVYENPSVSMEVSDISCFGGNDGSINLTVTSGTPPYSYNWSNGYTGQDPSGLSAGTYSVTVTDGWNGCSVTDSITISEPLSPIIITSFYTNDVSCFGGSDGSIGVNVSGGIGVYSYEWTGSGTGGNPRTDLSAGNYSVTVTDANGCNAFGSATITQPTQLNLTFASTPVTCNGGSDGSIDLTVNGGDSPYFYSWSNGYAGQDPSGLSAGNYSVTVTDANGCSAISSNWFVSEPDPVYVTISTTSDITCHGDSDGSLQANVSGGTGPYIWVWSNGDNTQTIDDLEAGMYEVILIDAYGCSNVASTILTEPPVLTVDAGELWNFCNNSGEYFEATATGGSPYTGGGYTWLWNNGINTPFHLAPAWAGGYNYNVTVTDQNGCTATDETVVNVSTEEAPFAGINLSQTGPSEWVFSSAIVQSGWIYEWDFGDGYQSTLSNVAHEYTIPGSYLVTLVVTNSCGSDTAQWTINVMITSIGEVSDESVRIYPNPVNQSSSISVDGLNGKEVNVQIFDVVGKIVYSANHNENILRIPAEWPAGVYHLKLRQGDQTLTKKLIVHVQ